MELGGRETNKKSAITPGGIMLKRPDFMHIRA